MARIGAKKKKPMTKKKKGQVDPPVMGGNGGGDASISLRKIANGWLISESGIKRGKYVNKETFSKTKPAITIK